MKGSKGHMILITLLVTIIVSSAFVNASSIINNKTITRVTVLN